MQISDLSAPVTAAKAHWEPGEGALSFTPTDLSKRDGEMREWPELVAEVKFLTWTDDNLLRQVVYEGLCEDKPAAGVRRPVPHSSR